jgi:hypothetical protein
LCSKFLILPDESQEAFDKLLQGWIDDYEPDTHTAYGLVEQAARAEWELLRAFRRYDDAEQWVYCFMADPMSWGTEDHQKIERFTRYRTTKERAFTRAFNNLEHLRKSRHQESNARERIALRRAEHELKRAKAKASEPESVPTKEPPQQDAEDRHYRPVAESEPREREDRLPAVEFPGDIFVGPPSDSARDVPVSPAPGHRGLPEL